MPNESAYKQSGEFLPLKPVGGVDLFLDAAALDPSVLSRSEDLYIQRGTLDRRPGAVKIARLSSPASQGHSRTFGTTGKYATFTPALIPAGGFAVVLHFVPANPSASTEGFIVGARPAGQTYHVFKATITPAGDTSNLTVSWRDSAGATHTIVTSIDTSLSAAHLLAIYDAVGGTFKLYVNGGLIGSPITGLSSTLKPAQDAGVVWTFGVEKQTGSAVTADSQYLAAIDGMTIFTLRGKVPTAGFFETLRRHSARAWPSPWMDFVLAHYDMDESSGTVMWDRSDRKNNGAYVGSPTVSAPVALLSAPCHLIDRIEIPGGRYNVVGSWGSVFYEPIGGLA